MPRFKHQRGSAVVEFVMLGAPALLLFSSGVMLFLNSYIDTVARAIAIDASRYAALADQDSNSAKAYLDNKIMRLLPQVQFKASVQRSDFALVDISYLPIAGMFSTIAKSVQIKVVAPIETNQ